MIVEFVKADKVRNDEDLMHVVMRSIRLFAELQDYKGMYKSYYIPKSNKMISDIKRTIRNSKFKAYIRNEFEDIEEYRHETIRLAIVGLFHKYENFRKELVRNFDAYLATKEIIASTDKYAIDNYNFKIRDNWKNDILFEVNWLSNRVKHDSSLPVSFEKPNQAIPTKFQNLNTSERIIITPDELYYYIDGIYSYCVELFNLFNYIALRIHLDEPIDEFGSLSKIDELVNMQILKLNTRSLNS